MQVDLWNRIELNDKQAEVIGSPKRANCVQGGFGSGKSVAMQGDMLSFALDNPRSTVLCLRKTHDQVIDSVVSDLKEKFTSPDPSQRLWPEEILHGGSWEAAFTTNDRKPELRLLNDTTILFRGIIHDGREDPKKFGSVPFAGVYVEEFSELKEPTTFRYLDGRCRQKTTPGGYNRVFMVGNPPDQAHWSQYEFRELPRLKPEIAARRGFYILPTRDNVLHLPVDYIENMEATYSRSWVKRYLEGHTGIIEVGQPVLTNAFSPETSHGAPWHVAEGQLEHSFEYPVIRGWDFGVAYAACVWVQIVPDPFPHVLILHELTHRQTSAQHFAPAVKVASAILFPDCNFIDVGDPSGRNRSLADRRSPFDVLRDEFGINVQKAKTNETEKRKDALINLFSRVAPRGQPFAQIANTPGTEFLRDALEVGWAYPTDSDGYVGKMEPQKNEYCVPLETEALTPSGWKTPDKLHPGDEIYGYEKGKTVKDRIASVNVFTCLSHVLKISNDRHSWVSTPNHRNLIQTRAGVERFVKTKDLQGGHFLLHPPHELVQPKYHPFSDDFVRLAGWIMAEGTYRPDDDAIILAQSEKHNPEYCEFLDALIERTPGAYRVSSIGGMVTWRITKETAILLRHMMPDKVPSTSFIRKMSNRNRRAFLFEFMRGDGHFNGMVVHEPESFSRNRDLPVYGGTVRAFQEKANARDALQMIGTLVGIPVTVRGKMVSIAPTFVKTGFDRKRWRVENGVVDGVWCPTTGTGTWIARQGGRVFLTGNSHCADALSYVAVNIEDFVDSEKPEKRVTRYKPASSKKRKGWKVA